MQATANVRRLQFPRLDRGRRGLSWLVGLVVVAPFALVAAGWVVRGGADRIALAALALYSVGFAVHTSRTHGRRTAGLVTVSGFVLVAALIL